MPYPEIPEPIRTEVASLQYLAALAFQRRDCIICLTHAQFFRYNSARPVIYIPQDNLF